MNTSLLLYLLSFFSLLGASAHHKFDKQDIKRQVTGLLANKEETIEKVKAIFENADETFNDDFDAIKYLDKSEDAEVIKYVLSKSVNADPAVRATGIREILDAKTVKNRDKTEFLPGNPMYDVIISCFDEIKNDGYFETSSRTVLGLTNLGLARNLRDQILNGNLPLVKKFVEAGFPIPEDIAEIAMDIENNIGEMLKFLVRRGLVIKIHPSDAMYMMSEKQITAEDFGIFLELGLPLDYAVRGRNWLYEAIRTGCFDIAEMVYDLGLRLSKAILEAEKGPTPDRFTTYKPIQGNIDQFVKRIAPKQAFKKIGKYMLIGRHHEGSALYGMPLEMIHEMLKDASKHMEEVIVRELYV